MTSAADSGNGSLVNSASFCCTPSSKTVKSFCNSPSTSLPSLSFTVTGTVTKLTFFTRLKSWSRPLSPAWGPLPGGTVLISCEPGGGGCGLVCPGVCCGVLRVSAGCSGFPLEEEDPGSPGAGRLGLGAGALFCGAGASGSGCCASAQAEARVSATATTASLIQKLNRRLNMGPCRLQTAGTVHKYN